MLFWFWCFDVPFTKKTEDGVARIMVFLRFVIYFPMMTNWRKSKKIGISSFIYLPNHWFSSLQIQTAYFIFASKSSESFLHQRFFLLVIRLIDVRFVKKNCQKLNVHSKFWFGNQSIFSWIKMYIQPISHSFVKFNFCNIFSIMILAFLVI